MARKAKRAQPLVPTRYGLVTDALVKVVIYNTGAVPGGVGRLEAELVALLGNPEAVACEEYGGPGTWTAELTPKCKDSFELGQWAGRIAAFLVEYGVPAEARAAVVARFGME